jgi:amidase
MARTVRDAALLLSALAGPDPADPATAAAREHLRPDYTKFLDPRGLRGARLGVVRKYFGFHEATEAVMDAALEALKHEGAELIDPVELPSHGKYADLELTVLLYELKEDLNAYLRRLGPAAPVKSLADVIEFNEKHRDQEMPHFGQDFFHRAQANGPDTAKEYQEALAKCRRLARAQGIDAAVAKHKLDALVAPTGGPAWLSDLVTGDHYLGGSSDAAAVAGYPNVTVPAGHVHGLPVGLSFFGPAWSEPTLLRLAYAFEQATKARRRPRFLPSAVLS